MSATNQGSIVPNLADSIAEYTRLDYGNQKWIIWYGPPSLRPKEITSLEPEEPRLVDQRIVYQRSFLLNYGEWIIMWDPVTLKVEAFGSKVPEQAWRRTRRRYFDTLDLSALINTTTYQDRFVPCTAPSWLCNYYPTSSPCVAAATNICGYLPTFSASGVPHPATGIVATATQAASTGSSAPFAVAARSSAGLNSSLEVNASCQIATLDATGAPGVLQLV